MDLISRKIPDYPSQRLTIYDDQGESGVVILGWGQTDHASGLKGITSEKPGACFSSSRSSQTNKPLDIGKGPATKYNLDPVSEI